MEQKSGGGCYLGAGHEGTIIINRNAVIGEYSTISVGVVIGKEFRGAREGAPTIGDYVWIGANAVIVGNIKVGSDVLIAPNSYVNFDVSDHSIVIGNPGRIIRKENATQGYINI